MSLDVVLAACTAPAETTVCNGANAKRSMTNARNRRDGSCVDVSRITSTTSAAYDRSDIDEPSAPCFGSDSGELLLDLNGTLIAMSGARLAGVFVDGGVATGLLLGFVSQSEADATKIVLPQALGITVTLGSLLAGDRTCCETDFDKNGIIDHDDRDVGPDGHTVGWWFYLNFTAVAVPYSE
jgi:hypothetical protein